MSFSSDYSEGKLRDFFALAPSDTTSALELPRTINRPALVTALKRYATTLDAPPATFKALETLKHPKARVVVTGQQAGVLLGPNYTLSKAITALN
jgi:bacillithiol synthase